MKYQQNIKNICKFIEIKGTTEEIAVEPRKQLSCRYKFLRLKRHFWQRITCIQYYMRDY